MKILCCALVLFVAAFAPSAARAADFSGTWVVNGTIGSPPVGTVSPVCVFKQDGKDVRGSCKGPHGLGPAHGTVDGEKISWHWDDEATDKTGSTGTATFNGVLGADGTIKGTWISTAIPDASGTFTMQKVK